MQNEEIVKKYMLEEVDVRIDLLTGEVGTEILARDACKFFDDFGPAPMFNTPEKYVKWASEVAKEALSHRDSGSKYPTTLIDKMFEFTRVAIRCQEGVPATIVSWKLCGVRDHEVIASVEVTTDDGNTMFIIWAVMNLDTEEVYCL